ncbi:MAG: alpha/beta hydrolase [Salinivirgaceae bacterium]
MKKAALFLASFFFIVLFSYSQNSISKTETEYDSLVNNTIYGKNEKAGKFYTIRGFKMYCETYGYGEPLLLIHGNGASINAFVKQIPFFSTKYKVIVADSRAHGKSFDKSDSLSYEMMADDYAALLSAMNIDSANVIGWSDGGVNGILLAIRHPEKVKKLAITGANLQPDSSAISPDILKRTTKTYNMFITMFKEERPKSSLDSTVYKYIRLLKEQPHISFNDLHKISIPTLVIGGDHDVIRPGHTLTIFENLTNAYLWILPNSGHSTLVRYAEEFNNKVDVFFETKYRKIEDKNRTF